MTSANCSGNEELDFRLIFGEDGQQQPPPLGPAGMPCGPQMAVEFKGEGQTDHRFSPAETGTGKPRRERQRADARSSGPLENRTVPSAHVPLAAAQPSENAVCHVPSTIGRRLFDAGLHAPDRYDDCHVNVTKDCNGPRPNLWIPSLTPRGFPAHKGAGLRSSALSANECACVTSHHTHKHRLGDRGEVVMAAEPLRAEKAPAGACVMPWSGRGMERHAVASQVVLPWPEQGAFPLGFKSRPISLFSDLEPDDSTSFYILNVGQPPSLTNQSLGIQRHGVQPHAQLTATSPPLQPLLKPYEPSYESQDSKYPPTGGGGVGGGGPPKAFECPSIQITSISPSCQQEMDASEDEMRGKGPDGDYHDRPLSRDHLYLPLDHSYRDSSLSPSPCSSLSSRSWFSDASSCESISHVYDDVDSELNEAAARFTLGSPLASPGCSPQGGPMEEPWHQQQTQQHHHHPAFAHSLSHPHAHSRGSPCHSPRTSVTDENWLSPRPPSRPSSRPTSPCGKRRHSSADICYPNSPHHSPTPTPGPSPRGSVTEDTWIGSPSMGMSPFQCCPSDTDIPSKTRKTSQDRTTVMQPGKADLGLDDSGNVSPLLDSPAEDAMHGLKKDGPGEQFLSVPSHFTWNKPKPGHTPIFRTSSLPPLDWPLPNQYGQFELKIEVHPKAHHRAHYETEGSRGAVKAASGGHPIVKSKEDWRGQLTAFQITPKVFSEVQVSALHKLPEFRSSAPGSSNHVLTELAVRTASDHYPPFQHIFTVRTVLCSAWWRIQSWRFSPHLTSTEWKSQPEAPGTQDLQGLSVEQLCDSSLPLNLLLLSLTMVGSRCPLYPGAQPRAGPQERILKTANPLLYQLRDHVTVRRTVNEANGLLIGYNEKPVNLQMFIGTADDRYLRPHAFYQVHRITGKTVATASQEIMIASTKVLEIPLLPENNMSASIDCAGILKLRNSDIELRKGETDIGRKNTRVRVVFRVHIPQPNGKVLSLQAASIPVECSQRSAQELPQVEKVSLSSCPVSGGEEMVITGSNFFPESKVIFLEKGPDGRPQWEVEAKIIREKSQGCVMHMTPAMTCSRCGYSSIVVDVPPYHSKTITSAAQVQFYVCNGKRKRSQSQRFTYLSVLVKQEHRDDLEPPAVPPMPMPLAHAAGLVRSQPLSSPEHSHPQDGLLSSSPRALAPGLHPLQAPCAPMGSPTFPHLPPHLQARGLHPAPECQMPFHPAPRASYSPLQHNLPFNGQAGLPMPGATSPQAYERMPFQPEPAGCHPLGLGMVYGPPVSAPASGAGGPATSPSHVACTGSSQPMALSTPHLHSLGYHCPTPGQLPPSPTHALGQPAPQLQRPLGYHPAGQRSASCPTPSSAPVRMVPSPHSGPSSPQLHSLPYQSPTSPSPTSSPLGPLSSPQASSPVLAGLPATGPLVHPMAQQQQAPFPAEGERLNIKQEPEDREPTFRSIGLQDITLDD
ncbi:hypothetical protein NFI96_016067, partial [Prochilodus magdalenae]